MQFRFRTLLLAFLIGPLLSCQHNVSPDTYAVGSVGQVNRTVRGTVISARPVNISGSQSGLGAGVGAVGGGIAGSALGSGVRSNALGALGGAVVGGVVGAVAEEAATQQTGVEYVIETSNGALLTVVQGPEPALMIHQKVLVIYGTHARVIADPT
jgi:outer membrane lipoprotein SlyB